VEAGDNRVDLPVIVVRGQRPGRTLVVTAGIHGDEYEGVHAIFDVIRQLDPQSMSGDLICVPVANPPAFWAVSRCSPLDGANLARVFPGKAGGSITEAIAHAIDGEILRHADFFLDLHSAGVRFLMPTMVGYDAGDSRAEAAAHIFGAPVIWAHDVIAAGRSVSAASARGIPWLYTEARGAGRIHPDDLAIYRNGIINLLRHLRILPGEPEVQQPIHRLYGDGNVDASITTRRSGFLIPEVNLLQRVNVGQRLGVLFDLWGNSIESFTSPRDGVVALIHVCPVVKGNDPLFLITGIRE
jgi:N-alpha-acetyl-L-2,4-diaminobutyrate deacetylase